MTISPPRSKAMRECRRRSMPGGEERYGKSVNMFYLCCHYGRRRWKRDSKQIQQRLKIATNLLSDSIPVPSRLMSSTIHLAFSSKQVDATLSVSWLLKTHLFYGLEMLFFHFFSSTAFPFIATAIKKYRADIHSGRT